MEDIIPMDLVGLDDCWQDREIKHELAEVGVWRKAEGQDEVADDSRDALAVVDGEEAQLSSDVVESNTVNEDVLDRKEKYV